jgi:sec-independent protein translocase protein TatA
MIGDILQPTHLLFILAVALLVLGPKRLPEAGRALGKGIRDFRMAISGEDHHHDEIPTEAPAPSPEAVASPVFTPTVESVESVHSVETTSSTETVGHVEHVDSAPKPPVDHAIQAAMYAATPAEDAVAEPDETTEQPAESAHSVG